MVLGFVEKKKKKEKRKEKRKEGKEKEKETVRVEPPGLAVIGWAPEEDERERRRDVRMLLCVGLQQHTYSSLYVLDQHP